MNTRLQLTCTICGTELHNGLDTFGDVGDEMCQECWIHLPEIVDWNKKQEPHVAMIFEFEPGGKKVKSITYKIVEHDDDVFDDEWDFDDDWDDGDDETPTRYCHDCDVECEVVGRTDTTWEFFCPHCDKSYTMDLLP